jgi:hypothetical protein
LATARSVSPWAAMTAPERDRRVQAYRDARDRAILRLPERLRGLFASEWEDAVGRALARGDADFDERGRVRLVRRSG